LGKSDQIWENLIRFRQNQNLASTKHPISYGYVCICQFQSYIKLLLLGKIEKNLYLEEVYSSNCITYHEQDKAGCYHACLDAGNSTSIPAKFDTRLQTIVCSISILLSRESDIGSYILDESALS